MRVEERRRKKVGSENKIEWGKIERLGTKNFEGLKHISQGGVARVVFVSQKYFTFSFQTVLGDWYLLYKKSVLAVMFLTIVKSVMSL
jgi:hypothetical protein